VVLLQLIYVIYMGYLLSAASRCSPRNPHASTTKLSIGLPGFRQFKIDFDAAQDANATPRRSHASGTQAGRDFARTGIARSGSRTNIPRACRCTPLFASAVRRPWVVSTMKCFMVQRLHRCHVILWHRSTQRECSSDPPAGTRLLGSLAECDRTGVGSQHRMKAKPAIKQGLLPNTNC